LYAFDGALPTDGSAIHWAGRTCTLKSDCRRSTRSTTTCTAHYRLNRD
jgi:hypothetical protein